ncbi:MAG: tyrosine-type recombinase/integrase [Oscillospiraceae bacterium]|jgi:integrase/recombinase XerD|uniref:tyrosine-type recombinase/integrase n=1 Tax=Gemmiger formicilis TaxID=745368 RepID=UPI0022E625AC|nr:tyrosine-type recombinase/integrase [Gemmiger formicilis]UYI82544.1 MAG: tyrosine-type recombinase/integrase [Oscillospiraceae bacterium]
MAQIRTRKTKVNGQNGIALEITKRGKGERTADNTFLLDLFTEFKTAQEDKGNSQKTIEFYLRGYFKLCEFIDMVYMKAPAAKELGLPAPTKPTPLSDVSEKEAVNRAGGLFPISILTTDGLERDYRKYLTNLGVNEQTIAAYFRAYRAIAYFAMEEGWIPRRKISIKQPEPPIKNCYTDDEIKRLVRKPKTDDFLENRNWVMVNYFLATGNRVSSVADLRIGDVDLDEGYITVNRQKNGKPTRIPLVKKITRILRAYIDDYRTEVNGVPVGLNEPLFCNLYGEKLSENGIKKAIANYNRSRNVEKTSVHLFRHTFAKKWIIDGGDLLQLEKMLGQSSLKMVQHYSNLYASDIKEQAEKHAVITKTRGNGRKIRKRIV